MLHYFDRASMAHSLEVRVPFLDHQLVELCATIPSAYKLHRFSRSKHLLKVAARGLMPDQIIDKPKVGFFNRSVEGWLRAQTDGAVADYLLDPVRGSASSSTAPALERLVTHASSRERHVRAALPLDARDLAADVPAASAGDPRGRVSPRAGVAASPRR